jgi:tight adherence protein C
MGRRARGLDRLVEPEAAPERKLPDVKKAVRRVAGHLGQVLPFAGRRDPVVRRRLIRAGYRGADAERSFQALRAVIAATAAVLGVVIALQRSAGVDRLLLWSAAAGVCGYMAPMQWLLFRIRGRKRAIEKGLPNALDLMVVCVESGLGIDQTVLQVSKELQQAHPEISEEFTIMNLELRAGKRRAEALHNLAERTGVDDVRKLVSVLVQTDRFGTSIAQSLRGHADYLRIMSRQRAEEKASKIAVKLVFPIFFCILPSLFVVTVGPVITRLVRDLIPLIKNM